MHDIDAVLNHYMITALWWSSTDDGGNDLDSNWGVEDIAPETVASMRADVADFLHLIERERPGVWEDMNGTVWSEEPGADGAGQVGHDLWLTRNGHGTGFWDRYWGGTLPRYVELGDFLAHWAKTLGESHLYVGDDRKIHHE